MADNLYWIWLSECCQYDSGTFDCLMRRFSSPRSVFLADEETLASAIESDTVERRHILLHDLSEAERIMRYCAVKGIGILTYDDDEYPALLRLLSDPPPVLYYLGNKPHLNNDLGVAVVGTRKMSEYGKRMAFEIAYDLARAGAVVVSGLALGIDGVAAAAALAAGARTVAVLGSGLDILYPKEHVRLMNAICRKGTVLSEFAPGTPPNGKNFPRRNRIISGLSRGTLVVEGNIKSGALITARLAEKQGKDVFALPSNADEEMSEATALLLKNGAHPVTCADDIIKFYEPIYGPRLNIFKLLEGGVPNIDRVLNNFGVSARHTHPYQKVEKQAEKEAEIPLKKEEKAQPKEKVSLDGLDEKTVRIYQAMPLDKGVLVDELCKLGYSAGEIMAAFTLLEIHKCVQSLPGGRYIRR